MRLSVLCRNRPRLQPASCASWDSSFEATARRLNALEKSLSPNSANLNVFQFVKTIFSKRRGRVFCRSLQKEKRFWKWTVLYLTVQLRLFARVEASFSPMPESTSPTGYEPNSLIEDNSKDLNEMTSMEIKTMFFHMSSMTSTYDPAESIATPRPESNLDDDQIRNMLTDHEFITLSTKTQCPVHLASVKVQGNLSRCSHKKESRVKTHLPIEKAFPQDIKRSQGEGETFVRIFKPKETLRFVLEDRREDLCAGA